MLAKLNDRFDGGKPTANRDYIEILHIPKIFQDEPSRWLNDFVCDLSIYAMRMIVCARLKTFYI